MAITKNLLTLTDIVVPGEKKINPNWREAERICEQISVDLGIHLPNYEGYHNMCTFLFPQANLERLVAVATLNNWLYYIDDTYDRNQDETEDETARRKRFDDLIYVVQSGHIKDESDVLQVTALKLRELFVPISDPRWLQRMIRNTMAHLKATTYDIDDIMISKDNVMVDQYIALREHDSGMVPTVDLLEFTLEMVLPDHVLEHPVIRAAIIECCLSAALQNDLFSYTKEVIELGSQFNLVAVYMHDGYTFDEAVDQSVRLINRYNQSFMQRASQLPQYDDPQLTADVRRFYYGLSEQIDAAWHWQYSGTNRYRSSNSPFLELQERITVSY